jgi:pimeloyl-ACP methyl ester carboxylesterase
VGGTFWRVVALDCVESARRKARGQGYRTESEPVSVSVFALVHGGAHGGWCWELLVPELEKRGHAAVAPDLPIEDDTAGALENARVVVDALEGVDDDVVVVGHSLAGLTIPLVAQLHPVRRLVFLGAMVPAVGMSNLAYLATEPGAVTLAGTESLGEGETPEADDQVLGWERTRDGFYHDVPDDLARHAWERLRPQSFTVMSESTPLEVWPDVPSTYILMTEDRAVGQDWSRRRAKEIGADLIEMEGSHSPFYSRPAELADILVGL